MLLLLLACQASPILQPATYASDSGRVTLEVQPSDRSGLEGGECTLRKHGAVVWEEHLANVPWSAAVAEDGTVAAFSLSGDYWAAGSPFHVLLLAPDGSVVLDEEHPRVPGGYSHSAPQPTWAPVFLQDDLERFSVLIRERDGNRTLWMRDLRTGAAVGEHRLTPDTLSSGRSTRLQEARSVPGTRLVLLHWIATSGGGASFQIVAADAKDGWRAVWRIERAALSWNEGSAILEASEGRFDIRLGDAHVGFEVSRTASGWRFAEIARARFEEPVTEISSLRPTLLGDEPHAPVRVVRAGPSRWRFVGPVVLGDVGGKLQQIEKRPDGLWFRDIQGVAEAGDGSVAVVDCEPTNSLYVPRRMKKPALSFFDADGTPRRTSPPLPDGISIASLDFQSGRVLVNGYREAFLFDVEEASFHRLDLGDALREARDAECALSADRRELTCVQGDRVLRFALPR